VREFKQLQDENARLKKLVAELSADKAILQDVAAKDRGSERQKPNRQNHPRNPSDSKFT
jgi:hypothetical protein